MNVDIITALIGNFGFPIVCCLCCFYFINKTINDIRSTLDRNTEVINELLNTIKKEGSSKK